LFGLANVVPVGVTISRPNDDAILKCVSASPTTTTVSAWYRNSSHGKFIELSPRKGKYLLSNNTLTVMKVGEWFLCSIYKSSATVPPNVKT